jgi:hypothetical protein
MWMFAGRAMLGVSAPNLHKAGWQMTCRAATIVRMIRLIPAGWLLRTFGDCTCIPSRAKRVHKNKLVR